MEVLPALYPYSFWSLFVLISCHIVFSVRVSFPVLISCCTIFSIWISYSVLISCCIVFSVRVSFPVLISCRIVFSARISFSVRVSYAILISGLSGISGRSRLIPGSVISTPDRFGRVNAQYRTYLGNDLACQLHCRGTFCLFLDMRLINDYINHQFRSFCSYIA